MEVKKVLKNSNINKVKYLLKRFEEYSLEKDLLTNRKRFFYKYWFEIRFLLNKNFRNNQNYLWKINSNFFNFFSKSFIKIALIRWKKIFYIKK